MVVSNCGFRMGVVFPLLGSYCDCALLIEFTSPIELCAYVMSDDGKGSGISVIICDLYVMSRCIARMYCGRDSDPFFSISHAVLYELSLYLVA